MLHLNIECRLCTRGVCGVAYFTIIDEQLQYNEAAFCPMQDLSIQMKYRNRTNVLLGHPGQRPEITEEQSVKLATHLHYLHTYLRCHHKY